MTAEPPTHFSESLAMLGFNPMLGDLADDTVKPPPTKALLKTRAKAHAKTVRKERKGERRGRGTPR